jgi:hypothetical protein
MYVFGVTMGVVSGIVAVLSFYPFGVLYVPGSLARSFYPFAAPLLMIAVLLAGTSMFVSLSIACRWIRRLLCHRRAVRACLDPFRLFPNGTSVPRGSADVVFTLVTSILSSAVVALAVYVHVAL